MDREHPVVIKLMALEFLIPVALSVSETVVRSMGFDEKVAMALRLATEEIFCYLCRQGSGSTEVKLSFSRGYYYASIEFVFDARDFPMKAFNLTATADAEDESCETGLILASRAVDRFKFSSDGNNLCLVITKEKDYPPMAEGAVPAAVPLKEFSLKRPDSEELKLFLRMLSQYHNPARIHREFHVHGKVVDKMSCGELSCAIAVDKAGHIGGGILWHFYREGLVMLFGPYLLGQTPESPISVALLEHCINNVARTHAIGILAIQTFSPLPEGYFETIGTIYRYDRETGEKIERTLNYRYLREDPCGTMWCHPSIEPFLEQQYRRLYIHRELKHVSEAGEVSTMSAVIITDIDKVMGAVQLFPVWWGPDALEVLEEYVKVIVNDLSCYFILFVMDLGKPWQCLFTPALLSTGFKPAVVVPHGARGDMVLFQYNAESEP
ncbi:MAG: ATP-binding protein [Candidatus Eremiobacteraeota bacterium]|nr:ATP-binding protein [Candidatus Eremiobacteraeota bacterium]